MKTRSIIFILAFTFFIKISTINAQVKVQDSLALVDLYDSTDGPNWNHHDNWLTGPVSTWYGISVAGDRVTAINFHGPFSGNNLKGNIPPKIGNLTNLQNLDLYLNKITGIPPEIGNLKNLQNLDLGLNQITGIPPEIGSLASLLTLDLRYNQITDLPPEIGNLASLQTLDLDFNQITNIPPGIGNLSSLQNLNLSLNYITGIPSEIGNLASLQDLQLQNNQIINFAPELGGLTNLERLALSDNKITTVPAEIGQLTNLSLLFLDGNQIPSLPAEIGNLTSLTYLDLGANQLTVVPSGIGNLTSLQSLSLELNDLTSLPPELANLNPNYLDLSSNNLTFKDLEWVVQTFINPIYYPQANIPVYKKNDILFVSAGGTLSNNTYRWFMVGAGDTTIAGDSVFHPSTNGNYYATITNSICTQLILNTDTVFYDAALPVTIINLKAQRQKNIVQVGWTSVTEINVADYEIQRSSDILNFSTVNTLPAKGNGTQKVNYTFNDVQPLHGNNYYRIKAVDKDGKVIYSNTALVDIGESKTITLVYPNPAKNVLHIQTDGGGTFVLTDQSGKILLAKTVDGNDIINVAALPSGLYYLKNNTTGKVQKVIIF